MVGPEEEPDWLEPLQGFPPHPVLAGGDAAPVQDQDLAALVHTSTRCCKKQQHDDILHLVTCRHRLCLGASVHRYRPIPRVPRRGN